MPTATPACHSRPLPTLEDSWCLRDGRLLHACLSGPRGYLLARAFLGASFLERGSIMVGPVDCDPVHPRGTRPGPCQPLTLAFREMKQRQLVSECVPGSECQAFHVSSFKQATNSTRLRSPIFRWSLGAERLTGRRTCILVDGFGPTCAQLQNSFMLFLLHRAAWGPLASVVLNVDIRQPCGRPYLSKGPVSLLPLANPLQPGGAGGTNRACFSHGQWLRVVS